MRTTGIFASGRAWLIGVAALLAAACGQPDNNSDGGEPPLTAATLGAQDVKIAADYLAEPRYASADLELGNRLLMQCRACHTIEEGGGHRLGPNLYGMFGREAGALPDFGYTAALKNAEFTWTPRALDAWLAMPSRFLPGNAMAYGGIPHADDRAALIASLLRQSTEVGSPPASQ